MQPATTGIPGLDEVLRGGLLVGDNVVWVTEERDGAAAPTRAFLAAGDERRRRVRLVGDDRTTPRHADEEVVALPRAPADAAEVERTLLDHPDPVGARLVVDGLDALVARWGAPATVAFYRRVCPRLLDLGTIAYWTGSREMLSQATIDGITKIAQCVFDSRGDRLRIVKAEGRPAQVQGTLVELGRDRDGTIEVGREQVVGRLGEGLRRLRRERNLTQAQLAALAGVTPAAISQAETGRRGLSLDTLVPLTESLGIALDDLVGGGATVDHLLVRHDRARTLDEPAGGLVPLFGDPAEPLRSYLVTLGPEESGAPAFAHKGLEAILVADGLVLIDLGDQTPVMRAADALMVRRVPIRGWSNLGAEPARFFWVVSG
ncbi:XRE family transcriptional regulator [Actinomarinicola tropica]|uniref:Helix-turn-helix domain-containing protein n=1 Tax=Actinomarinicola tropica TaxID=2789776 RepID=A0A5Q2RD87_9ACTN|nr:XRE family transcriptional regulator [Actinomarinicola tropica]QGG93674.1 helix-turn-helix domain-containing protein [Actinomarinicola tropica]